MSANFPSPLRFVTLGLLATLCGFAGLTVAYAAEPANLGWMTSEEMAQLPEAQQRPIPEWCSGIYYAPRFSAARTQENTLINANRATYSSNGDISLTGDVTIRQPLRYLSADSASYHQKNGDFSLKGNSLVQTPYRSFQAKHISGNSQQKSLQLDDAQFAIFDQHARGSANGISRENNVTYIYRGSYTTCEPGQNGWMINARRIRLDHEEGWGTAKDMTLEIKDIPVLYLPWITFPINDDRKTGLLFPSFSLSDEDGFDYTQPIYLNIHPQFDMTLAPRIITKRGVGMESQARYLTQLGEGQIDYAFIQHDRQFHDQTRSVFQWTHNGHYGHWNYNANVNYVSDPFYFKDLGTNTLDMVSRTYLPRTGSISYSRRSWQLITRIQSWQVIDPTLSRYNYPFRRVPEVRFIAHPRQYGPIQVDWWSSYTYFDRSLGALGDSQGGGRWHIEPALSLPLVASYGYFTPRIRLYSSYYNLHGMTGLPDERPTHTLAGFNLDTGLFFERQFDLMGKDYLQTLEPRLFYNYIPYREQQDTPNFDASKPAFSYSSLFRENRFLGYDKVGDANKLALGVTSRIIDDKTGQQLWRFRVGQGIFFEDRYVHLTPRAPSTDRSTPLVADATFRLNGHWSLFAQKQWSHSDSQNKEDIFRLSYRDPARRYGYIGYRRLDTGLGTTVVQQGELAGMWPVTDNWSLLFSELYDLDNHRSIETVSGIEYRDCCWKLRLINRRLLADYNGGGEIEPRTSIVFQIQLIGLGGIGDKAESLLEDTIPGYRRIDQ